MGTSREDQGECNMSEYTERAVRFGHEASWGTYGTNFDNVEYCLTFDATTTEEKIEEDLVSSSRQARSRAWAQRSVVGSWESNIMSPRLLYYALGSVSTDAASPYTINFQGDLALPSFSIERTLRGQSDTFSVGYYGCKVDRYELLVEAEQDITQTVDWIGKNNQENSYTWSTIAASGTFTSDPFTYLNACFTYDGNTLRVNRVRIEINNNLTPRYGAYCTGNDPTPFELREGAQIITGEFTIDEDISDYAIDRARARSEGTIIVIIGATDRGTMTMTMNKVTIDEFPDTIRGKDVYEIAFPFTARATGPSAYDAFSATYVNATAGTVHDMGI